MATYTLNNSEDMFKLRTELNNSIELLRANLDSVYAIVQNDGITIGINDLLHFSKEIDKVSNQFNKIEKQFSEDVSKILNFIESCEDNG